jgi:hypothetical protein
MGHFADIERCGIGERNEGIGRHGRTFCLGGQPRRAYFFSKSTLPGLRRAGNAG